MVVKWASGQIGKVGALKMRSFVGSSPTSPTNITFSLLILVENR